MGPVSPRVIVTICTYNEAENLPRLVPEILAALPQADVLVIDDASPDGTGRLAEEMAAANPRIRVMHRQGKLGLGTAITAGLKEALARGYDFVLNMDADFSHHPRHLPAIWEAALQTDVAVGSRYVKGGGVVGWSWVRKFMSAGINWYARLLLRLPIRDCSGAYRCYRVAKLSELDLDRIRARGYAFQEEILYRCRRVGCRFTEVPILFEDRRYGQSKINLREVVMALWVILVLGWENLRGVSVRRS